MVKLEFDNCTLEYQIGDCLELMKDMPDKSIDLTITSPPYDNLREYGGYSFDFEGIAKELFRITKDGGVIVWVVGDATINGSETGTSFKQALFFKEIGFNLHDTMIWLKRSPPLTHKRYEQGFEYMFVLSKGNLKTFNPIKSKIKYPDKRKNKEVRREKDGSKDMGYASRNKDCISYNTWDIPTGGGHSTKDKCAYEHPAIFPEKLAKDHILSWSNEGDTILDCFLGSGTTMKMCGFTSRNCIGFEINPEYESIIRKRIMADTKTLWQFGDSESPETRKDSDD